MQFVDLSRGVEVDPTASSALFWYSMGKHTHPNRLNHLLHVDPTWSIHEHTPAILFNNSPTQDGSMDDHQHSNRHTQRESMSPSVPCELWHCGVVGHYWCDLCGVRARLLEEKVKHGSNALPWIPVRPVSVSGALSLCVWQLLINADKEAADS